MNEPVPEPATCTQAQTPNLRRSQLISGLIGLVVLIAIIALIVGLSGKGGTSIHPQPAPADTPTATALVSSRAP